jgi:flagellar biosynthetic protein FliP
VLVLGLEGAPQAGEKLKVMESEREAKDLASKRAQIARQQQTIARLAKLPEGTQIEEAPFRVVVPSFVISELKTAFQIGFMIFIPFLVIDMVVSSVLMSLGMMMLSPVLVALPFKLMLFVLADGWNLLVGSLAASFAT